MNSLKQGFVQEIEYQKRMINNIKKYLKISIIISACCFSIVLLADTTPLKILGIILLMVTIFLSLIFGLAIHNGYKNVEKVIETYESHTKKQAV